MREIRLIAFNRPEHTRQCVDHLLRCRGLSSWRVVASVDGLPDGGHNPGVVEQLRRIPGVDLRLRKRLGMNGHIRVNWTEFLREGRDSLLHLEDDIILAPDALEFCEQHESDLLPNGAHAGIILHGTHLTDLNVARARLAETLTTPSYLFNAYGAYLLRPTVERLVANWKSGWGSWDCGLTDLYHDFKWRSFIPVVPRARNIGYTPGSWLASRSHRPIWSGDMKENRPAVPASLLVSDSAWQSLVEAHPWPAECPDVADDPALPKGWTDAWAHDVIDHLIRPVWDNPKAVVVELGAWMGLMSRRFVSGTHCRVVSIDTWVGGPDHARIYAGHLDRLYRCWQRNLWPWRDRLVGLQATTMLGLRELAERGIEVAAVWIDADHHIPSVAADLAVVLHRWPNAQVGGHDWPWKCKTEYAPNLFAPVPVAVNTVAAYYGREVVVHNTSWRLKELG